MKWARRDLKEAAEAKACRYCFVDGSGSGLDHAGSGTMASVATANIVFEHDIPWTLVRAEAGGGRLVLRYPTMLAPEADVRLKPAAIEVTSEAVTITLTEVVRTEERAGLTGVYFDTRETRILLDEPLGDRAVKIGHVAEDMDAYREVLRNGDEEARRVGQ